MSNITIRSGTDVIQHKAFTFAGGETQVRLSRIDLPSEVEITAKLFAATDIMELLLLKNAIDNAGVARVRLVCPYLPYARQDRVCAPGEAFSLKVMCQLINRCSFESVEVWDVHSKIGESLLHNCTNRPAVDFAKHIKYRPGTIFIAPDQGAVERARQCAGPSRTVLHSTKVRDPNDGAITSTLLEIPETAQGSNYALIIDDICDGGRTFLPIAKILKEKIRCRVGLYVTHGIFSQGQEVFDGLIDDLYTANLFPNSKPIDKIIQL